MDVVNVWYAPLTCLNGLKNSSQKFRESSAAPMTAIKPAERPQSAPSLEEDYALLKVAAREAGELALTYFRKSIIVKRKIDGSEVSEADLALDVALKLALHVPRPNYGWLSEETEDDPERLAAIGRAAGRGRGEMSGG